MDNIIQLIVFFFIIYSILAPILGKKKQQKTRKQIPGDYQGDVRKTGSSPRSSGTDILEDILGFKIPKTDDEYEGYSYENEYNQKQKYSKDYDTDLTINYKNLEQESKTVDLDYDKLSASEIKQKQQSQKKITVTYSKLKTENKKANDIRKKLTNPSSFREIFLITEILNKPKAFRK